MIRLLTISSILFLISCHNSPEIEKSRVDTIKRDYQQNKLTEQEYEFLLEAEKDLNKINEVIEVDAVTGPYDVIVKLECEKLSDLTKDLIDNIHSIEGVIDTTTSLAVELKD